jgi:hypothetical protein
MSWDMHEKGGSACRSRLPFRFLFGDSLVARQQTSGSAGQHIMVSIMVVIIEGFMVLCVPVVFRAGVFITKALYGHTSKIASSWA